jgi:hypothetical protein
MKQFTIEVKNASGPQLQTIGLELKIMSNNWERFGPKIFINGQKLQAPSLREPSRKRQASSNKRHSMNTFQ